MIRAIYTDKRKRTYIANLLQVSVRFITRVKAEPSVEAAITSYGNGADYVFYDEIWITYIEGHADRSKLHA